MNHEELQEAVLSVLRNRLGVRVTVGCRGNDVNVTVRLIDVETGREFDFDRDSDRVTIYASDVR